MTTEPITNPSPIANLEHLIRSARSLESAKQERAFLLEKLAEVDAAIAAGKAAEEFLKRINLAFLNPDFVVLDSTQLVENISEASKQVGLTPSQANALVINLSILFQQQALSLNDDQQDPEASPVSGDQQ